MRAIGTVDSKRQQTAKKNTRARRNQRNLKNASGINASFTSFVIEPKPQPTYYEQVNSDYSSAYGEHPFIY